MQFQVPQFIEVEDKIFGPFTFKQFIYIAGGLGMCYIAARILPLIVAAPLIIAVGGLSAALAFFEWNGRPFIHALESGFFYALRAKLYLWSNKERGAHKEKEAAETQQEQPLVYVPRLSESKLHDLAWSLDIKERIAEGSTGEHEVLQVSPEGKLSSIITARDAMRQ